MHTFIDSAAFFSTPQAVAPLSKETKEYAIKLLFGSSVTKEQKEVLSEYIDTRYSELHSLAMKLSEEEKELKTEFANICSKLGLDPGKKEVIITNSGTIRFSSDYRRRPEQVEF